jgi:hypothetical protein
MFIRAIAYCSLLVGFGGIVSAQNAVDGARRYNRLICLVHLTGSGGLSDPVRPEYVPIPGIAAAAPATAPSKTESANSSSTSAVVARPGILAWSSQATDDRKMVIVHLVAADRRAFASVLADTRAEIRVFEIGVNARAEIETEMRKYKKDFNLDDLTLRVP